MRTTITIDDDVLLVAKAMAEQQRRSLGDIISDLARNSLPSRELCAERNGIPLLRVRPGAAPVTLALVNTLRDELP